MSVTAYIALGSNLQQPAEQVRAALAALAALPECSGLRASSLYVTAPVGYADQPDFINAVARLDTTLSALALLAQLQALEAQFGRERSFRNAPRVLDLDLLLYGDQRIDSLELSVPHPRMHERAFVLAPLAELAPALMLPQGSVTACLAACAQDGIRRLDIPPESRQG